MDRYIREIPANKPILLVLQKDKFTWLAYNSNVLTVSTVMSSPVYTSAFRQLILISPTGDLVQPNRPDAFAELLIPGDGGDSIGG